MTQPTNASGPARWLPYAEHAPALNMGIDEALLRLAREPVLRFYGWSPPAISLGRFQKVDGPVAALLGSGLPVVRRLTGGGAIVHWHEVTYSILLPLTHPAIDGVPTRDSYAVLHRPIVDALVKLGVPVEPRRPVSAPHTSRDPAPLCFHRVTDLDLIAGGQKILGSAQRRTRGWLLQHGSLILQTNEHQPETATLADHLPGNLDPETISRRLAAAFESLLGPLEKGTLTLEEAEEAKNLAPGYELP